MDLSPVALRCLSILALIFSITFVLYRIPEANYFLIDSDGGTFLQGADQSLRAGEHAQANFLQVYGPLSFEIRAALMALLGDRTITEVIYATLGYGIGYWLMYRLALRLSGSQLCAAGIMVIAILCLPRYYKIFVVLAPMLTATAAASFIYRQSVVATVLLGLSVSVATLFRQDTGAYCFVAAMFAILAMTPRASLVSTLMQFLAGAAILALPWLLLVAIKGSILDYLTLAFQSSTSLAGGLSLPHPLLHWNGAASLLFLFFYLLPPLSAASLWWARRNLGRQECVASGMVIVLSTLCLAQSAHRADVSHLLQGGAPALLGIAIIWRSAVVRGCLPAVALPLTLTSLAAIATLLWSFVPLPMRSLPAVANAIYENSLSRNDLLRHLGDGNGRVAVARFIESCTAADERVQVFPYAPNSIFFAGRLAGGKTTGIAPGYFNSPAYQQRVIDEMKAQPVPLILWNESMAYDGLEERKPTLTHALIHDFVKSDYRSAGVIEEYAVYILKGDPRVCGGLLGVGP